jgi:hypothetical protein
MPSRARFSAATRSVVVDKSARRVVYSLQWTPPFVDAFRLEVMAPGSTSVAAPTHARALPQARIQTFDKPEVGTWSVRVRRNRALRGPVPYTLNVFFNERHLDYRLSVSPAKVGEPLRLRAEISYDGKPLAGLPADAVRVRVLRPKASLAAVLRGAKGKPRRPKPGDPQTNQQLAVTALSSAMPAPAFCWAK